MKNFFSNFLQKNPNTPYIIAEIGVNHEGKIELAKKLIDLAKQGGAHAAKFQTYKASTLAAKKSPAYWDQTKEKTSSQFELFQKYDGFGANEYQELAHYCKEKGIQFVSTPFDLESVDMLDPLMPFFKIASADITNIPLLKKVAQKNKPVVVSTGASRLGEVAKAIHTLKEYGASEIAILHCVLNYPCPDENANLEVINTLKENFPEIIVGYSDHTVPDRDLTALIIACQNGAQILEKHFTHDKTLPGNDHYHAMNAEDCQNFLKQLTKVQKLSGTPSKEALKNEHLARLHARRSLVINGDIKSGMIITEKNIICKRPASGINPKFIDTILGSKVKTDLPDDHILQWSDVELKQKPKVVALIQARLGSTRLEKKMLKKINDTTVIEWVINRVKKAKNIDSIVLTTTQNTDDKALVDIALKNNILYFQGSENNVAERFHQAATNEKAQIIVRICADNPFIDSTEIDNVITTYLQERPDYAFNHRSLFDKKFADGFGAEVFDIDLLEEIVRFGTPSQQEHLTQFFLENADSLIIKAPESTTQEVSHLKFDVDTEGDFNLLVKTAQGLTADSAAKDFISNMKKNV